ncbi:MAG: pseudouridine synthase [Flavobacteriales bacterium]
MSENSRSSRGANKGAKDSRKKRSSSDYKKPGADSPKKGLKITKAGRPEDGKPRAGSAKKGLKITRTTPDLKANIKPGKAADVRLNRYIANSGMCSRREADVLISSGVVSINGKSITELGTKVKPGDVVKCDGHTLSRSKMQYVLLNKPKNFVTNAEDPMNKRTVMQLIKTASKDRLFPIDKLDRNTTGLLLFTNDGNMAKKLTDSKNKVRQIYHVTLKEKVKSTHLPQFLEGIELPKGTVKANAIEYIGDGQDPHQVGIEMLYGKDKLIVSMFEHFGYSVIKLDRVIFSALNKKDLPRGKFRHLSKEEVAYLHMV